MKRTITAPVWCSRLDDLPRIFTEDHPACMEFFPLDMTGTGWLKVGTATIHLDLVEPKDTVAAQIEALEAQCKEVMADSEATLTILRSRINDLLAIEGGK